MISPISLEIAVLIVGMFLLLFEAFANEKDKSLVAWLGVSALGLILVASFFCTAPTTQAASGAPLWRFYTADSLAFFFKRFALLTTILVLIMSVEYKGVLQRFLFASNPQAGLGEFYALPVLTCAGLMWMASAVDFVFIFVSIEVVTVSFYVLVSYMRRNSDSLEAGVKYLILGALSTGFLVYGITWIFGVTGETNLLRIGQSIQGMTELNIPLLFGVILVLVGLGFKIAAAPFQLWVPDVYQGAPTPIAAFLSVGSKAAGFVVLMRVLQTFAVAEPFREKLMLLAMILAALTLIYGNLAAMPQDNLKRLLAYSSIGHAGYLLVAVASMPAPHSGLAITFYLAGYLLMTLLSFFVLVIVTSNAGGDDIAHFNGLAKRSPILAFSMLISMLSLAGVPFTAGFIGKFMVFDAAINQRHFGLVAIGVVTVAAGFYFYLKVVRAMYWQQPAEDSAIRVAPVSRLVMGALAAAIVILGVYPQPIFRLVSPKAAPTSTVAAFTGK